ncbi:hypothetical protein Sjap_018558 [Stephania japonica]|uniref:Uncharacterized protein n=1 Tax=Stephania japonica TaxID=461633 RepID=A0AAP0NKN1_9MAGN
MTDHRLGSGSGRAPPSSIGQGGRVQTSIGCGRGRGRVQNLQQQPRREDHIPPAPPERGLALIRPPPPSVIRPPAIRPDPFGAPSHPASRPRLTKGILDFRRDAPSPPTEQLISTGLAELPSMTRPSPNSTPSSSTHHSTPSLYAGGTSTGATHDSPSSSTHPSTPSFAPRHLPNVKMPHAPAPPPELTRERDVPRIRIIIKNGSLHIFDVCAWKMTDTFKKGMIPEGYHWKSVTQYQRDIYWKRWRSNFNLDPQITALIMAAYESMAKVRYKELMNKLLTEGERPIYVTEEAWRRYVEYWESDDFKARSKITSSNQRKQGAGEGLHGARVVPSYAHEETRCDCWWSRMVFHLGYDYMLEHGLVCDGDRIDRNRMYLQLSRGIKGSYSHVSKVIDVFMIIVKTSLGNLLTGLIAVCVGQLSADPGTSKSKGKESYGRGSSDDVSSDVTGAAGLANGGRGSQDDPGRLGSSHCYVFK